MKPAQMWWFFSLLQLIASHTHNASTISAFANKQKETESNGEGERKKTCEKRTG